MPALCLLLSCGCGGTTARSVLGAGRVRRSPCVSRPCYLVFLRLELLLLLMMLMLAVDPRRQMAVGVSLVSLAHALNLSRCERVRDYYSVFIHARCENAPHVGVPTSATEAVPSSVWPPCLRCSSWTSLVRRTLLSARFVTVDGLLHYRVLSLVVRRTHLSVDAVLNRTVATGF